MSDTGGAKKLNGGFKIAATLVGFVITLIAGAVGYGRLDQKVANNADHYKGVKDVPAKIAAIEARLERLPFIEEKLDKLIANGKGE